MTSRAKPKPIQTTRTEAEVTIKPTIAYFASVAFIPDWHPTPLNELMGHPMTTHRKKTLDQSVVATYCRLCGVRPATCKRRVRLVLVFAKGQRCPDPDAFWKSLADALVQCGALVNDSRDWVEYLPVEYCRGDRKSSTIVLEDMM